MKDTDAITLLALFAVSATAATIKAGADGFQVSDIFAALPVVKDAVPALRKLPEVPGELADLSEDEALILQQTLSAKLSETFPPGYASQIAQASLALLPALAGLVDAIKAANTQPA